LISPSTDPFLAPYAIHEETSKGRKYREKSHSFRGEFQRDRDRIIHSAAFRRLQYKTQVFVNHEGDHYRTRLTHTLETAQIARTIARALHLNEDLTETIALAHDIGHGPFGHAGEWALRDLMKRHGGFEHNQQCLRIVEHLEESYPDFPGLNLMYETLEGLKKHPENFYKNRKPRFRSLESELVDIADEIAYNSHDLDDGLRSGLVREEHLSDLGLWQDVWKYIKRKYPKHPALKKRRLAIRLIINTLVVDCVQTTQARIKRLGIKSLKDVQAVTRQVVGLSEVKKRQHVELKRFLYKNLYSHSRVVRMTQKGQRFLEALFRAYLKTPKVLPRDVQIRAKKEGIHRAVCDYIAGMTDRFAQDEYDRFFEPYERLA